MSHTDPSAHWIARAEAALRAATPDEGCVVLRGKRPSLLDAQAFQAILTPLMAALTWAVAVFRESVAATPLDPWALLTRVLALGLSVRALLLLLRMAGRVRHWLDAPAHALVLCDEGLLLRRPDHDVVVPRTDVVHIVERGNWGDRGGARWSEVYLVMRPQLGRPHLALPPFFDATPGALAERLMRWRGVPDAPETPHHPAPVQLASKLYDEVAAGRRPPGVTAIPHGRGWLRRGPYVTLLMGVAVLDGLLRLPGAMRAQIGPLTPGLVALALVVVPVVWIAFTRRSIRPRRGLALVLTPAEMLMRATGGTHRVRWPNVQRLSIQSKRTWSLLEGQHASRALLIQRKDGPQIRYDEAYLGIPAEVALGLCQAYRQGLVSADTGAAADAADAAREGTPAEA